MLKRLLTNLEEKKRFCMEIFPIFRLISIISTHFIPILQTPFPAGKNKFFSSGSERNLTIFFPVPKIRNKFSILNTVPLPNKFPMIFQKIFKPLMKKNYLRFATRNFFKKRIFFFINKIFSFSPAFGMRFSYGCAALFSLLRSIRFQQRKNIF